MTLDLSHPLIEAAVTLARAVRRVGSVIPKGFAGIDKLFEACAEFEREWYEEFARQAVAQQPDGHGQAAP